MTKGVYFILIEGRNNIVKIGRSSNCERRIKQLQTGNPDKLYIHRLEKTPHDSKLEAALHNFYKPFHYQKGGGTEWFTLSKDQINRLVITPSGDDFDIYEKKTWFGLAVGGLVMAKDACVYVATLGRA